MLILLLTAALIGFIHSLAHGLPVVLIARTQKWSLRQAVLGAWVTASGHILMSLMVALGSHWLGGRFIKQYQVPLEQGTGLLLGIFGLVYAFLAFRQKRLCHHDSHAHLPPGLQNSKMAPLQVLFILGFTPCFGVLPVFAMGISQGNWGLLSLLVAFSLGVVTSLTLLTSLLSLGLLRWHHDYFEHYGEVISGFGVFLMGIVLCLHA